MKMHLFTLGALISSSVFAGGSMGGGTPPSLSDLSKDIMLAEPGTAGLFDNGAGDVGLLTRGALLQNLTIGKSKAQSLSDRSRSLAVSEADFVLLRDRTVPVNAVNTTGASASYLVKSGDDLETIILEDRRETARKAVQQ